MVKAKLMTSTFALSALLQAFCAQSLRPGVKPTYSTIVKPTELCVAYVVRLQQYTVIFVLRHNEAHAKAKLGHFVYVAGVSFRELRKSRNSRWSLVSSRFFVASCFFLSAPKFDPILG